MKSSPAMLISQHSGRLIELPHHSLYSWLLSITWLVNPSPSTDQQGTNLFFYTFNILCDTGGILHINSLTGITWLVNPSPSTDQSSTNLFFTVSISCVTLAVYLHTNNFTERLVNPCTLMLCCFLLVIVYLFCNASMYSSLAVFSPLIGVGELFYNKLVVYTNII